MAWPSATIVSANAKPSSSDTDAQLICGSTNSGQGVVICPIVRTAKPAATAIKVAAVKPISIKGKPGRKNRTPRATSTVVSPIKRAALSSCPSWFATCVNTANALRSLAGSKPKKSGKAYTAINTAAPDVKPNSAAGEIKLAKLPRRSTPIKNCITPTISVTANANWI